jgi:hypothetical protein
MPHPQFVLLAAALIAADAPSSETEELIAAKYLQEMGLEDYHGMCVKYISLLTQGKPETGAELLVGSLPEGSREKDRERFQILSAQISGRLAGAAIEDIELVGVTRISSKAVGLCYIVNADRGPAAFILAPFQFQGAWHTHTLFFEPDFEKILDRLKWVDRFSGNTVVPITREGKAT